MIVNVDTELGNYAGILLMQTVEVDGKGDVTKKEAWTFGSCAINALMAMTDQDRNITGNEKLERYKLATKISNGDKVDLTIDELKKIKDRAGLVLPTILCGAMLSVLEKIEKDFK